MAIIKCPECGQDVSDQAESCVHCGYPLSKRKRANMESGEQPADSSEKSIGKQAKQEQKWKLPAIIGVIAVAAVIAVILLVTGNKPKMVAGQTISFGHYPQTESGGDLTPIEWTVLDVQDGKALLLSKYGLDAKPYNTELKAVTWETCTMRAWLNGEFLNKAFSAKEQSAILTTDVDNGPGQGFSKWNTTGGNNTRDKVFLLSYAEANRYLGVTRDDGNNLKSRVAPTAYALAQGAYTSGSNKTEDGAAAEAWWLRSPGRYQYGAAGVSPDGSLGYYDYVHNVRSVVRPAFWLNLESDIF